MPVSTNITGQYFTGEPSSAVGGNPSKKKSTKKTKRKVNIVKPKKKVTKKKSKKKSTKK